jgi:hypothetical protein
MTKDPQLQIQRRSIVKMAQDYTSEAYLSLFVFLSLWLCDLPALTFSLFFGRASCPCRAFVPFLSFVSKEVHVKSEKR